MYRLWYRNVTEIHHTPRCFLSGGYCVLLDTQHMCLYFFFCKVHINQAWNGFKCSAISVGVYHKCSWMGTFQAWEVYSPLEERVCWKMSLMSKPKCLRKPGCLTTYCWHICEFLVESCVVSWCFVDAGELRDWSRAGSVCGLRALGSSGLVGSQVWALERRSFGPLGFSVRWLTV